MALVGLFNHYKSGHLAIEGGVMDQPALYLRAMEVCESRTNKIMNERLKK